MKISDMISELETWNEIPVARATTCDVVKVGEKDREVHKVAIAMFGTMEVLEKVFDWGADFLIVHEPLFYDHMDQPDNDVQVAAKQKILKDSGLTVYRFHDYAHCMVPDMIYEGEIRYAGLKGRCAGSIRHACTGFILDEPMTAAELAETLEKNLGIPHIRVAGCLDKKSNRIACAFGSPGALTDLYREYDYILAGEIWEWKDAEYARDAAHMGRNKAILAMGHETSERAGMMYMQTLCEQRFPGIEFRYFESGSVFAR